MADLSYFGQERSRRWYSRIMFFFLALIIGAFGICAGYVAYQAVIRYTIPVPEAVLLVLLILSVGACFVLFLYNLELGISRLEVSSHWGGLGGGLGGWRVSKALAYLIAAALFVGLLVASTARLAENSRPYLIERYRSAIQLAQNLGVRNLSYKVVDSKLVLTGTTDQEKTNKVWEQIKLANITYDDIQVNFAIESQPATTK